MARIGIRADRRRLPGRRVSLRLVLVAALAAPHCPATEVYRWTDEEGRVHFGDRPPNAAAESIEVTPPAGGGSDSRRRLQRTQRLLDSYAAEREQRVEKRREQAEERAERRRNCDQARARQHSYENASHIYRYDADGNKAVLDGADYEAALAQTRDEVDKWCGRVR